MLAYRMPHARSRSHNVQDRRVRAAMLYGGV